MIPNQIFVCGISTGALHTATYVFRPELLPPGTARPAGAVLFSGPYTFDFSAPTKGELAYFGEDKARWPQMVVTGNVTRTDIPVLLTTAEWDDPRYFGPEAQLFKELLEKQAQASLQAEPRAQPCVAAAVGGDRGHERVARGPGFHRPDSQNAPALTPIEKVRPREGANWKCSR